MVVALLFGIPTWTIKGEKGYHDPTGFRLGYTVSEIRQLTAEEGDKGFGKLRQDLQKGGLQAD
jgi:hypothetical protein